MFKQQLIIYLSILTFSTCFGQNNQSNPLDPSYYSNPKQLIFSNTTGGIVQMQRYYDQVTVNLSSTVLKFTSYLEPDAKYVLDYNEIARTKLKELQNNLKTSKNYTQAESMRMELINIYYFEELPLTLIKKNFDDFTNACDLREKLVLSNRMTLDDYESWKTNVLELYSERGGCNLKNDGSYNSISKIISEIAKN
jgi:hypothetical protein